MKDVGTCLTIIFFVLSVLAYIAGAVCLGVSLIWLAFGIAKNATLAFWGFGLAVGGKVLYIPLSKAIRDMDFD